MADVIGAALEQRHRDRSIERLAHGRYVAQEQLILQILGSGRDNRLAAPKQGRHQVGKGFASTGAGFCDQGRLRRNCRGNRLRHFSLGVTWTVAADGATERTGRSEQGIEFYVVNARGGRDEIGFSQKRCQDRGRLGRDTGTWYPPSVTLCGTATNTSSRNIRHQLHLQQRDVILELQLTLFQTP